METGHTGFNDAQLKVLDMMSFVKTPEAWKDLQEALSDYFARKAQDELDNMWANGTISTEKIESFRELHARTPYRKATI